MPRQPNQTCGIEKLITDQGSPGELAKKLSTAERPCSRQLVEYWMQRGYVTGTWPLVVNEKFGTPLHELNPRMYPEAKRA